MIELQRVAFSFLNAQYEASVPTQRKYWAFKLPDHDVILDVILNKHGGIQTLKTLTAQEAAEFQEVKTATIVPESQSFRPGMPSFDMYSLLLRDGRIITATLSLPQYGSSPEWVQHNTGIVIAVKDVVGWRPGRRLQ